MICLSAPVGVAVVDRIENNWAVVELSVGRLVEVQASRLPVGVQEADEVCFCSRPKGETPWAFQVCSRETERPRFEGRYFGINEF